MNELSPKENLVIIWANADPETAQHMAFMYARNSLLRGWWKKVRLIVWGPSARTLRNEVDLQELLPELRESGVELLACRACAEQYGAEDALEAMGLDVRYIGGDFTAMLKEGWTCLTV